MTDALVSSGISLSPYLYGGIGFVAIVAGALILLFRRKSRLKLEREALQKSFNTQTLPQPAVSLKSQATPTAEEEPQGSLTPTDQKPEEDNAAEQSGVDLTAMFKMAPSVPEKESQKDPAPANDASKQAPEPASNESSSQSPKLPAKEDSMLDLFTTEIAEDSNVAKLASSLEDIAVSDIMNEAHDLVKKLRGHH